MDVKKIIGMTANDDVIGSILKSSMPTPEPKRMHRGKLSILLGLIAAIAGTAAQYL